VVRMCLASTLLETLTSTRARKGKPGVSNVFPDVILFIIDEVPPIDEMVPQILHTRSV
jgi:hypothetical protein